MNPTVWLIAAENAHIPGGKVGGVGDVLRDLPVALARNGQAVRVIVPAYGAFHRLPGARQLATIHGEFAGEPFTAQAWQLPSEQPDVQQVVIHHERLCPGEPGAVYFEDPDDRPYETDSDKFAFFCTAVAAWVNGCDQPPSVLHLHDWHAGLLPFLRATASSGEALARVRMVFTIHNLAYQGVRPVRGDTASLAVWFPDRLDQAGLAADPARPDLVNFMASAIRLADCVATVSPTYAKEIQQPNDEARGFHGGEGLEALLVDAERDGRLQGVLNGCEYPAQHPLTVDWDQAVRAIGAETALLDASPGLRTRLADLARQQPRNVLLNVGRVVAQKVSLLFEPVGEHETALDAIMAELGPEDRFLFLGSGITALEERLVAVAERHPHFVYLRGYAAGLSDLLYGATDLFLMPSSFEPCGISQMLAMRDAQPCVVHAVGGLVDTVRDGETGFVFSGETPEAQAQALVDTVRRALDLRQAQPDDWSAMRSAAAAQRFSWDLAARCYLESVYDTR